TPRFLHTCFCAIPDSTNATASRLNSSVNFTGMIAILPAPPTSEAVLDSTKPTADPDVTDRHPAGIQRDDHPVEAIETALAFRGQHRGERPVTVSQDSEL